MHQNLLSLYHLLQSKEILHQSAILHVSLNHKPTSLLYGVPAFTNTRNSLITIPNSRRTIFASSKTSFKAVSTIHTMPFNNININIPIPAKIFFISCLQSAINPIRPLIHLVYSAYHRLFQFAESLLSVSQPSPMLPQYLPPLVPTFW